MTVKHQSYSLWNRYPVHNHFLCVHEKFDRWFKSMDLLVINQKCITRRLAVTSISIVSSARRRDIILTTVSARLYYFIFGRCLRALNSRVDAHNEVRPPLITPDIRYFHNLFHASDTSLRSPVPRVVHHGTVRGCRIKPIC
jgi:hypothetical protein